MPYYVVKDFARGLDARRLWETTEVGALIEGFDVHISRGGEAEVRKGFIKQRTLAPGTHGLWVDDDGRQTVFGHTARPALLASDVTYIQCAHPNGVTPMNRVLSQDSFFGKPYIVAEFTDGTVHHYYDGERIRETGLPEDYVPPPEPEPEPEPEPPPPPTYPVGGGRSTAQISLFYAAGGGTTEIKGAGLFKWRTKPGTTNTAELAYYAIMDGPAIAVDQANVSAAVKELADRINAATAGAPNGQWALSLGFVKCNASASFNLLTVSIADYGTEWNGWTLDIWLSDNMGSAPPYGHAPMSGGEELPPPVPPPETGEPENPEPVPIEFRWSPGRFAVTHKQKVHATSGTLLHFSAIDNAEMWSPDATGAGFVDVSTHAKSSQSLVSLGEYQNLLAVFARKQVQLWATDPDPRRYQLMQVLHGTGTLAPRSVIEFGSGEVFYLDLTGIRALSARAIENIAYMSDVGSMIDRLVTEQLLRIGNNAASKAIGLVDPQDGRLWMVVQDRIYVLSYFPSSKISAWTIYRPGFDVDYADTNATHVWLRSGDDVYCYGGLSGTEFEDIESVAQLPFLDFQRPATEKRWQAIDAALEGSWTVRAAMDPTRPAAMATIGELDKSTYSYGRIALFGSSTHISPRFIHRGHGPARLGAVVLHYQEAEAG